MRIPNRPLSNVQSGRDKNLRRVIGHVVPVSTNCWEETAQESDWKEFVRT